MHPLYVRQKKMKKLNWTLAALALTIATVPLLTGGLMVIYLLGGIGPHFSLGMVGLGCWVLLLLLSSLLVIEKRNYHIAVWSLLLLADVTYLTSFVVSAPRSLFDVHPIFLGLLLILVSILLLSVAFFTVNLCPPKKRTEWNRIYLSKLKVFREFGRHETKA
jgi:hypothetical protein